MDLFKIHCLLLDAALPSTIEDLKDPTEDYILNLLTEFLSKFSIDMNLIDQPIPEQLDVMTYYEDSDFINLINLYTVLTQVLDKIFLHNFCLTDITSPGQKRLKKQAKYLSNFVLYTMLKKSEFNDKMEEIQASSKLVKELRERKDQVLESISYKALQKGKKLSLIEKLKSDIQYMKSEKLSKKNLELEIIQNDVEKKNQKVKEHYNSLKTETEQLNKMILELQSEIVHSPEEYHSNLNKLETQKNLKEEERNAMQEAIQEKKQSIEKVEEILNFTQKMKKELLLLQDVYKELKNKKTKSNDIEKEIDSSNNMLSILQTKLAEHKDQVDTETNKLQSHQEKDLVPLLNLHKQLLSEKKAQKIKLNAAKICYNEKCLEKNELHADISKIEKETTALLSSCQEIFDKEVNEEEKLRQAANRH
nr:PREDICTED: probable kinetochore protein nuf2 [Linepithema humile]